MKDLNAAHYRKNSASQRAHAGEVLQRICFRGKETVLDLGCGDGRITAEIARSVPRGSVTGIDLSPAMIALARASFPREEYPSLHFLEGDIERLSWPRADKIFILNSLHWIRNPKKMLEKSAASLGPGGELFILTYPKESPYWELLHGELTEPKWEGDIKRSAYPTIATSSEYRTYIEEAGLSFESFVVEERVATYPSQEEMIAFLKGWFHSFLTLPEAREQEFLEGVAARGQRASLPAPPGELRLPYLVLIAHLRK